MPRLKDNPSLVRGILRAFGITDAQEGVGGVSPEISPIFNPWAQPEHALLRDERWAAGYRYVAAGGAGTRAQVQLWNPTGSGCIATIEAIYSTSLKKSIRIWNVALTSAVTTLDLLDMRVRTQWLAPDGRHQCQLRYDNTGVAVGYLRLLLEDGAISSRPIKVPWIVAPGTGVIIDPDADNTAITASFVWREHRMLPGEFPDQVR